jgi:phosphate transport system substrate-binding protein
MTHRRYFLIAIALVCASSISCSPDEVSLQGSGATFPAPLYKRWFLEYYRLHPEVQVNYQPIGSGAGIRQFTEGLTAFGASDAAMSDAEMAKVPADTGVMLLPMTAGSISMAYNLPGTPPLRLSRRVLADILLGKITDWSDPALAEINKDVKLPALPITFVRRSEGSGTTFAFTNHLTAVSPEWKKEVGVGKSVVWKVGIGAKGNSGVAALIDQTPGAIGYIETGYAELTHLPTASLENKAGNYVKADAKSAQAALAGSEMPPNLRLFIADPAGEQAYPIVTYTWILCHKNYSGLRGDPKTSTALKAVLRYCLTEGQQYSESLGYVPLPEQVVQQVLKAVDSIQP